MTTEDACRAAFWQHCKKQAFLFEDDYFDLWSSGEGMTWRAGWQAGLAAGRSEYLDTEKKILKDLAMHVDYCGKADKQLTAERERSLRLVEAAKEVQQELDEWCTCEEAPSGVNDGMIICRNCRCIVRLEEALAAYSQQEGET